MTQHGKLHEVAGGEIVLWLDNAVICVQVMGQNNNDPIEMAVHEAEELVEVLSMLIREAR
jgi:hypothetical protein